MPANAPGHGPTAPAFSESEFRAALGMFATGVTIVTARTPEGKLVGLTANSFNSVSLAPPLVLWSLSHSARSMAAFRSVSRYAINILGAGQQELAKRFAARGGDRFDQVDYVASASGAPLRATSAVAPCAIALGGTLCAAISVAPVLPAAPAAPTAMAGVSVTTSLAAIERLRCASTAASVGGALRQARSEPFTVVRSLGATASPTVAPESKPTATGASTKWSKTLGAGRSATAGMVVAVAASSPSVSVPSRGGA